MRVLFSTRALLAVGLCVLAVAITGCGRQEQPATEPAEEAAPVAAVVAPVPVKVPVTTSSDEARALYDEGLALSDNLHLVEAQALFQQAVEKDPSLAMGYVQLAFVSQNTQSTPQFFDAVEKAQAHAAGVSAGEQLIIGALAAFAQRDQAAQLSALNELVKLHPKDERVHMALGNYYNGQQEQDFASAAKHYGHAVGINPNFASAYNSLGYAHRSNDDLDSAKDAFAKYIELIPGEANPYDSYAELLLEIGQYDESIENYRKALEMDPDFAISYAGISTNQSLKGDATAALATAAEMLAAAGSPGLRQAALLTAVKAHLFAGDTDAAMAATKELAADAVASGDHAAMGAAHEYMGDIMLDSGDGAEALKHFDEALKHRQMSRFNDANKAQAKRNHLFRSAIASIVDDDIDTATLLAAEYTSAVEANGTANERRRTHELAGYLAMMNEDNESAVAHLAQGRQVNPIVLYWSAVANKNAGNTERALELADRAANRNTLSVNLPFVRAEALQLIEELSGE